VRTEDINFGRARILGGLAISSLYAEFDARSNEVLAWGKHSLRLGPCMTTNFYEVTRVSSDGDFLARVDLRAHEVDDIHY